MSQAGAARDWQRWLEARYSNSLLRVDSAMLDLVREHGLPLYEEELHPYIAEPKREDA